ncbi:unnamed protein product, partial [Rotaria magnacalcarata]
MVTVTENLFIDTTINSTNKFLVNSEAHTSRRLLHRRSADEDEPGEEEDEVPAIENEKNDDDHEEEKPDEDVEETEEENDDDNLVLELNIDQLIHSKSPSKFSSFPSCPFTGGWGRGSRPISISPQSPPCPTLGYENVNAFDQHKSETSISKHINGNDQQQVTKNITITPAINEYYYHDYIPKRPFNHVIDFSFNVSTTKIIFDNENGFTKATHALQKNAIQHEVTRNYSDIWPFCLNSRTIRFFHLPELESQKLNNDNLKQLIIPLTRISPSDLLTYDSQYWFAFERRPTFNEEKFNIDIESIKTQSESMTNNTILGRIKFFRGVHVKLSYGALTSMNEYYYHPEYCFTKRTEWT